MSIEYKPHLHINRPTLNHTSTSSNVRISAILHINAILCLLEIDRSRVVIYLRFEISLTRGSGCRICISGFGKCKLCLIQNVEVLHADIALLH